MEAKDYLTEYYENYDEQGRLETRHGKVEFVTTMKYIERYLRKGMRVLEIGAATGRYSHTIARMGYDVTAVELVEHNIGLFKKYTQEGERVSIMQGNATDLSFLEDNSFDITLVLGPMYHLFEDGERQKAMSEAVRVTKKGGVIFCAYCMADSAIMSFGFVKGNIKEIVAKCMVDTKTFEAFSKPWDLFMLMRKENIDKLREGFDVTQLHYVAADGYANHMRETLAQMDNETYRLFLDYHLATCERVELSGYSNHTLDIFRKN